MQSYNKEGRELFPVQVSGNVHLYVEALWTLLSEIVRWMIAVSYALGAFMPLSMQTITLVSLLRNNRGAVAIVETKNHGESR